MKSFFSFCLFFEFSNTVYNLDVFHFSLHTICIHLFQPSGSIYKYSMDSRVYEYFVYLVCYKYDVIYKSYVYSSGYKYSRIG